MQYTACITLADISTKYIIFQPKIVSIVDNTPFNSWPDEIKFSSYHETKTQTMNKNRNRVGRYIVFCVCGFFFC